MLQYRHFVGHNSAHNRQHNKQSTSLKHKKPSQDRSLRIELQYKRGSESSERKRNMKFGNWRPGFRSWLAYKMNKSRTPSGWRFPEPPKGVGITTCCISPGCYDDKVKCVKFFVDCTTNTSRDGVVVAFIICRSEAQDQEDTWLQTSAEEGRPTTFLPALPYPSLPPGFLVISFYNKPVI